MKKNDMDLSQPSGGARVQPRPFSCRPDKKAMIFRSLREGFGVSTYVLTCQYICTDTLIPKIRSGSEILRHDRMRLNARLTVDIHSECALYDKPPLVQNGKDDGFSA